MSLQKISDSEQIKQIIRNAQEKKQEVLAWKMGAKDKYLASAAIIAIRPQIEEIVLKPQKNSDIESILSGSDSVNIMIIDDTILFQGELVRVQNNFEFVLKYPKEIQMKERRSGLRAKVNESKRASIEFKIKDGKSGQYKLFKKNVFDISISGISFHINKDEKKYFQVETILEFLLLTVKGESTNFKAKVANIIKVTANERPEVVYESFRIGAEYIGLDEEFKTKIAKLVLEFQDEII